MYSLFLYQKTGREISIGLFNSLEEARGFLYKIEGYHYSEEENLEYIEYSKLKDYEEIEFNGHLIPITKYSFEKEENIYIYWVQLNNFSEKGNGLVDGATLVDAYAINNEKLEDYVISREKKYRGVKRYLKGLDFEVKRAGFGSQDGEYILLKKENEDDWKFLMHLDPTFVYDYDLENLLKNIDKMIVENY